MVCPVLQQEKVPNKVTNETTASYEVMQLLCKQNLMHEGWESSAWVARFHSCNPCEHIQLNSKASAALAPTKQAHTVGAENEGDQPAKAKQDGAHSDADVPSLQSSITQKCSVFGNWLATSFPPRADQHLCTG